MGEERRRRDPEGRRRAIVEAAAGLILADGLTDVTHRRVAERAGVPLGATTYYFSSLADLNAAALHHLAEGLEADLRDVARRLAADESLPLPRRLAELLHAYLGDRTRLHADSALYEAAMHREELRPVALRWFDGLVDVLSAYTDRDSAHALALFTDGAVVHAMLHDVPLDVAFLTEMSARLLAVPPQDGARR